MNEDSYKHKLTDQVRWGKYKEFTVRELLLEDLPYFSWLYYKCTYIMFDLNPQAFRAFEWMINYQRENGKEKTS